MHMSKPAAIKDDKVSSALSKALVLSINGTWQTVGPFCLTGNHITCTGQRTLRLSLACLSECFKVVLKTVGLVFQAHGLRHACALHALVEPEPC